MLVDSNILIYAINKSSPKHKQAQQFLEIASNLYIAQQNVFESLRVLTHPKFPNPMTIPRAIQALRTITDAIEILSPSEKTYFIALELIKKYHLKSDQVYDAYLCATMMTHKLEEIATDNVKDFKHFEEIKVYNPFKLNN